MKVVWWILLLLTVVGAVNWGLVGFFDYDLVSNLLGSYPMVVTVVYDVVGVAGVLLLVVSFTHCSCGSCEKKEEEEEAV